MATEFHCSLGSFFYKKEDEHSWTCMSAKEVIRRLEELERLEEEENGYADSYQNEGQKIT